MDLNNHHNIDLNSLIRILSDLEFEDMKMKNTINMLNLKSIGLSVNSCFNILCFKPNDYILNIIPQIKYISLKDLEESIQEAKEVNTSLLSTPKKSILDFTHVNKDISTNKFDIEQIVNISPTLSNNSSSRNSIFSHNDDDELWNTSVDDNSNHTVLSNEDKTSSTPSITTLRNSKKVKDKALLFEKLIQKDTEIVSSSVSSIRKSYDSLTDENFHLQNRLLSMTNKTNNNKSIRSISRSYMEQIEKESRSRNHFDENNEKKPMVSSKISLYMNHVKKVNTNEDDSNQKDTEDLSQQRGRMIAKVDDNNNIFYEKL